MIKILVDVLPMILVGASIGLIIRMTFNIKYQLNNRIDSVDRDINHLSRVVDENTTGLSDRIEHIENSEYFVVRINGDCISDAEIDSNGIKVNYSYWSAGIDSGKRFSLKGAILIADFHKGEVIDVRDKAVILDYSK